MTEMASVARSWHWRWFGIGLVTMLVGAVLLWTSLNSVRAPAPLAPVPAAPPAPAPAAPATPPSSVVPSPVSPPQNSSAPANPWSPYIGNAVGLIGSLAAAIGALTALISALAGLLQASRKLRYAWAGDSLPRKDVPPSKQPHSN